MNVHINIVGELWKIVSLLRNQDCYIANTERQHSDALKLLKRITMVNQPKCEVKRREVNI